MSMQTILLKADAPDTVEQAAAILRRGGLVAIPTETVYGLGANGLDAQAVRKIFEAKGQTAGQPTDFAYCRDRTTGRYLP